jgi:RNA polymerase sigma-70 factor (ECF subfamily)
MAAGRNPLEWEWSQLETLLDEELHALPSQFRAPLILCCLNRHPHVEVSRQLGLSTDALAERLRLAYGALQTRLCRRGLTLSLQVLALLLSHRAASVTVPRALVDSTVEMAVVNTAPSHAPPRRGTDGQAAAGEDRR